MKKTHLKVIGILIVFFVGVRVGASGFWLIVQNNIELRYYLLEHSTANQPQAQIAEFVQAIVRGEYSTARQLWEIENVDTQDEITERRESVISDLASAGIQPDYMVLHVEWWSTCCEPSVTCDSRGAGGARMSVQFLDENGHPIAYIFDVFTREQPYWGAAMGYPPREWVIRDIYPRDEEPLFWRRIYESQVHYSQP